ncbi:hypothetical protein B0H19DRAFT_296435 [Mycena capillaripes]|nr:hypothetical protein B0H19DRAFT_296435 [Mycena capillaripes]
MEVEQQSDAARKKKTVTGSKNASTEQAGNRIEVEQHSEVGNGESVSGPRDAPTESAADDMEIEERSEIAQEKATPSVPLPARRPSPQVNAVASSSRVRLPVSSSRQAQSIASPELQSQPIRTPPFQRSQAPQPSSHRRSPMQSPSRRHHDTQRSPSPLDWGSPTTANPGSPMTARTPATSPSKQRAVPPRQPSPLPFDNVARSDRHSLSRRDVGGSPRASTSRALPRLFFTESGSNGGGSLRNRHRSIGSVEHNSLARRSRAASPRSDAHRTQYRLGSPPRASSSRPQSGTPLATKARRHAPAVAASLPFGFKLIPQQPADEPRRHSFPAALPRVDFHSMHSSSAPASAPRQSLPPRAPPRRAPPPQRRHSLFSPRAPPASTSVSPVHFSISANDRPLIEQLGLQTLMAMAQNHGFNMEVVRNLYARTGDLQKTDEILLRMRQTAEAAGEAALRGGDETPPVPEPPEDASFAQHHLRRHSVAATTRTAARSPPEPPEERFVLRHRREHSGATATTAPRSPPSAPSSSQRKKRQQLEEDEFHPQPLARDVLADTEYTPPSGSRAGAIARAKKKGRMEEGLQRERERATVSGGETLSAFARDARMRAQGRRLDMENDVPRAPTPQFAAFAQGNVRVMRGLEERDVSLAILQTGEVARYMADRTVPRAYR